MEKTFKAWAIKITYPKNLSGIQDEPFLAGIFFFHYGKVWPWQAGRIKMMRKCKWLECWHGAYVYPGDCGVKGDMRDPDCALFRSLDDQLKEWEKREIKKEVEKK